MTDTKYTTPTSIYKIIDEFISSYLPTCPVFQNNFASFIETNFGYSKDVDGKYTHRETSLTIGLYDLYSDNIFQSHKITDSENEIAISIEENGMFYIGSIAVQMAFENYRKLTKLLRDFERVSKKFLKFIKEADETALAILLAAGFFDPMNNVDSDIEKDADKELILETNMTDRFNTLTEELEYFSNIQKRFANSRLGQQWKLSVRGPKQNSALHTWIKHQAEVWVVYLNRELTQNGDNVSGRENFLKFAEDCMRPLHPDLLETDAIRNAFEKVRQSGQLDYLQQK